MSESRFDRLTSYSPDGEMLGKASLVVVIGVIVVALAGVYCGVLTVQTASLLVSSLLAITTFAYVLLTYSMATTMKDEMEHSKEVFKLRRKPDIIKIIREEINPLLNELWQHRRTLDANGMHAYDAWGTDPMYERVPQLETEFENPANAAALSNETDVNAGDVYKYYHTLNEYRDSHDRAVYELQLTILNDEHVNVDSDSVEDYAKSALAIEPIGISRGRWENVQSDVIPLRDDISELTSELLEGKRELKEMGHSLRQELGEAKAGLTQEYYISQSDL